MMKITLKKFLKAIVIAAVLCVIIIIVCFTVNAEEDDGFTKSCDHTAEIIGANISLDKDISLRYYVKLCDCYKDAKMVFSSNGNFVTKAAYYDAENDEYVYTLSNIAPQTMGDIITADLMHKDKLIAFKESYSVLENCERLLEKYIRHIQSHKLTATNTAIQKKHKDRVIPFFIRSADSF